MNKVIDSLFSFIVTAYGYNDKKATLLQVVEAGRTYVSYVYDAKTHNVIPNEELDHYLSFAGHVLDLLLITS
jgi:hypothetical protein